MLSRKAFRSAWSPYAICLWWSLGMPCCFETWRTRTFAKISETSTVYQCHKRATLCTGRNSACITGLGAVMQACVFGLWHWASHVHGMIATPSHTPPPASTPTTPCGLLRHGHHLPWNAKHLSDSCLFPSSGTRVKQKGSRIRIKAMTSSRIRMKTMTSYGSYGYLHFGLTSWLYRVCRLKSTGLA